MPRVTEKQLDPMAAMRGADVELRVVGGAVIRGTLRAADPTWLTIERHTGRLALVRTAAVATVCDERPPGLREAGRRDAEAAYDAEDL